jgi:transcriptional regulator, MarR family
MEEIKEESKYDVLRLESQLCFPLYACSKEIVRRYKPFLDEIDLTYTQYITMMVLWFKKKVNVKELGEELMLDSGTLTPVLKKLEGKGYITRERSKEDERTLIVSITKEGEDLKDKALSIPKKMSICLGIEKEQMDILYNLLYQVIKNMENNDVE